MKSLNDLLWDGKLKIYQDDNLFKYSLDSVLLANFITLNKNIKNVIDVGTGNAPIAMMLTKRTNAKIIGVEIQKEPYLLAVESVIYNKLQNQIELINDDIRNIDFANNYFDVIVCNPPYYKENMIKSNNLSKKIARSDDSTFLRDLFVISKKILKNNGNIAIVIDTKRLIEVINLMRDNHIEPKKMQFVYPKENKDSNIVLIEGTKNGKEGIKVLEPIIIQNKNNDYTDYIKNILENFGKY